MNLRQVEAFRSVMETGSMTSAARLLRISQPNVSRLVSDLERAMQIRLFDRTPGRISPTQDALTFYREVERSFIGLRRLEQTADDIRRFGQGRLRIAVFPAFGHGFFPHIVRRFKKLFPMATISVQLTDSRTIAQWVAGQQLDIGITADLMDMVGTEAEPLLELEGVCILPADHRLVEKPVLRPQDLEGESFISLAPDDLMRLRIDEMFEAAGTRRLLELETQSTTTICALVTESLGVSIVNPVVASDFRHRGLVIRRFEPTVTFRGFLLFPRERQPSRLAEAFADATRQYCREQIVQLSR